MSAPRQPGLLSQTLRLVSLTLLALPAHGWAEGFFTTPEAPFITRPGEIVQRVELPAGPVEAAQALIDSARKEKPDAVLLLVAAGNLEVGPAPLRLRSKMCLLLSPSSGLNAKVDCSSPSLVSVEKAEFVSISSTGPGPATLDGGGKPLIGIQVTEGSRINLDQLHLVRCGQAGIDYRGTAQVTVLNQAGSVTRSVFTGNGSGLKVASTGGFLCLDNRFQNHTGIAVMIDSLNGIVAGNSFSGNQTDIQSSSDRAILTRNRFGKSGRTLELTANSQGNLISENRGTAPDRLIFIAGKSHQLFHNTLNGSVQLAEGIQEIFFIANPNLQINPAAPEIRFFDPPTLARPHKNPVIVAGMGRYDLPLIPGGKKAPPTPETKDKHLKIVPVDLALVEAEITKARAERPNDVLVIRLEGEYICKNPKGLELPPNSCLVMTAETRILAELGVASELPWERAAPLSQVVLLPKTGFSSVSGGKLDANRQAHFPLNANTGSVALIEDTCLLAGARDGLNTKNRQGSDPLFVYRCHAYGNVGRGIWSHVANRVHAIANVCSGNYMDGIDLDAHAVNCTALFNICNANRRHGVFIEEAIENNIVFGNILTGNGTGIHVWNEEVKGNTGPNLIAANLCTGNRRGIGLGARASNITSHGNLFFNNVCTENREDGMLTGTSKATENYFSQTVARDNVMENIKVSDSALFFNVPTSP